ncbi:hypothetical protein [Frigidibacter sp. SD6-1]|uniref:hypothetical protein n=1 Tax=Frigidibacter sp. SD6-1 TaxID=3032581 RepID=UPI0024DF3196|nr:hypothetical protein [Frigidibacter sp. SD6-1]
MSIVDELGDKLAVETLKAMEELGNDRFYNDVAKVIGALSPSMQEAFMTSIRIRMASARGFDFVEAVLKAKREGGAAPEVPRDTASH